MEAWGKSLILSSIDPDLENYVILIDTTFSMLEKLDKIFLANRDLQISELLNEFYTFTFNSEDILTAIGRIELLVNKLNSLNHKLSNVEITTKIISILPTEYKAFRLAWDATPSDNKTMENLVSRLYKEERLEKANTATTVFKANERECFICKSKEHIAKFCPKNNFAQQYNCACNCSKNKNFFCSFCKRPGHTADRCFKRNNRNSYNHKPNNVSIVAVLDSGATSHMFKDSSLLYNLKSLNTPIACADNMTINAEAIGSCITDTCTLEGVLH
ncbi:uncharacterized protein LOC123721248 [Papilio machaon]|uniref:uncharacterized protein LOC123721248 n=1 Tax=Papilio machaon TaxID=76193 RepID=UPI001E66396C|nr:uncharacterized protein LOC123721248 [Papilio machaon]